MKRWIKYFIFFFFTSPQFAQLAKIHGYVKDEKNKAMEGVQVGIQNTSIGKTTDKNGYYEIIVPTDTTVIIYFSFLGYETHQSSFNLKPGEVRAYHVTLKEISRLLPTALITDHFDNARGIQKMNPREVQLLPGSQNIDQLIRIVGLGVSSGNELSSGYSVRGGNFDENLVYVNEFEVYRPFLLSEGQQEGLSIVNPQLIQSIIFSSGGFEPQYGDKMSSVLDIRYRKPTDKKFNIDVSLLGSNISGEGTLAKGLLTFIGGIRYKTTRYLLKALDTRGDYKPFFFDIQGQSTYQLSEKNELSWFTYASYNQYKFIPTTRKTTYGTINEAYQLTMYFDGQEKDLFSTFLTGFKWYHLVNPQTTLKYLISFTHTHEEENQDIMGQYWLGLLESDLGSDQFGNVAENLGIGTHWKYGRNRLNMKLLTIEHKGNHSFKKDFNLLWGAKFQYENVYDHIWKWYYIDSSGFSLPHPPDSVGYTNPQIQPYTLFELYETSISSHQMQSLRFSTYMQGERKLMFSSFSMYSVGGIRQTYWTYNSELLLSPRISISIQPHKRKNETYRFALGWYQQPPMYKELRDNRGNVYPEVKAQKSIHIVAGFNKTDTFWNRPFKMIGEVYYKWLYHLIPYYQDNISIEYIPQEKSKGYAIGLDFKIFGQFVPEVDSWFSLGILQTKEDIIGDYYYVYYNAAGERIIPGITVDQVAVDSERVEPRFIPRPTDRLVTVNIFFQDYMPRNPQFKMHLNLVFASGLPFGPPNTCLLYTS
ncbi:MAG: TonB-dependent receptor, partial [Bacteroidales bacterium]|nr:TonB-dependent receptor [Bacteroidales bacterium]